MEMTTHIERALVAFINNGVLGQRWPTIAYAVARYECDGETRYYRARSASHGHVEDAVFEHIGDLLQQNRLHAQTIKLYVTFSPCHECCDKIIQFMTTRRRVKIKVEIAFTGLYRVKRPSLENNPSYSGRFPSDEDHELQVDGLRRLKTTPGVTLRTFRQEDWQDLVVALSRRDEDETLRRDFEEVVDKSSRQSKLVHLRTCSTSMNQRSEEMYLL